MYHQNDITTKAICQEKLKNINNAKRIKERNYEEKAVNSRYYRNHCHRNWVFCVVEHYEKFLKKRGVCL